MKAFEDFEEKVTCPYDKSHYIRRRKMPGHLVKCAKNFPNAELVACDFNTTHRIPRPELRYHHEICPDRKLVENHIIQQIDDNPNLYPIQKINLEVDESWDNEEFSGYDPTFHCENSNVLRHMDVQSASKRKNFRIEERLRLNKFRDAANSRRDNDSDAASTSSVSHRTNGDSARGTGPQTSSKSPSTSDAKKENKIPTEPQFVTIDSIEEDAAHLSLADRIRRGNKKTYEPKN